MNRMSKVTLAVLLAMVGLFMGFQNAQATLCTDLGGTSEDATHCHYEGVNTKSGAFTLDKELHIHGGAGINVPAGSSLTINITNGFGLEMEVGGFISGNSATAGVSGAAIDIEASGDILLHGNVTTGAIIRSNHTGASGGSATGGHIKIHSDANITTEAGSIISSNGLHVPGGLIEIDANVAIDIDGNVLSESGVSGTGGVNQKPGGGPIFISAGCNFTCNDHCKISSKGADPGADIVHIDAGCDILIIGLVQSTATGGHAFPTNPPNKCAIGDYLGLKDSNAVACVEIVSGRNLTIASPSGEVNANTGQNQSWIDIFVRGDILIDGNFAATTKYRVHADRTVGNQTGGKVLIESIEGTFTSDGKAISANALGGGGKGGKVDVEAFGNVELDLSAVPSSIQARGSLANGPAQEGGTIFIRSWNGVVHGTAGTPALGELNAGAKINTVGNFPGEVKLQGCGTGAPNDGVNYTGNVIPAPAIILADACGGSPPLPFYITLPQCLCGCACIDLFTPTSGATGTDVTINGKGLTFATEVRFSAIANNCNPATGTAGAFVGPKTDATIHVTVPGLAPGVYNIIAICPTGSYCTSATFTVTP